jgi:hypothetical protein
MKTKYANASPFNSIDIASSVITCNQTYKFSYFILVIDLITFIKLYLRFITLFVSYVYAFLYRVIN